MNRKQDEEIKKIFKKAKQMKGDDAQRSLVVELAQEVILNVLSYYGCDPMAQKINLKRKSHREIVAKSVGNVFENMLIVKGLI